MCYYSIKPNDDITYNGDKTKEDIINFAIRMAGPPVQEVTRAESLANLKNMNQLFFMYVGYQEGPLWDAFFEVASKMQQHAFFYAASNEIAKQHVDIEELPAVFVHKENVHFFNPSMFILCVFFICNLKIAQNYTGEFKI